VRSFRLGRPNFTAMQQSRDNSMDGTIIKLTTPVEAFNRNYAEIALREPSGALFMRLGEPRIGVVSSEGGGYFVEQQQVISAYLDKLLSIDGEDAAAKSVVLAQLSLVDAIALKRALFSFFDSAAALAAANSASGP
jgi:hypothetical protein